MSNIYDFEFNNFLHKVGSDETNPMAFNSPDNNVQGQAVRFGSLIQGSNLVIGDIGTTLKVSGMSLETKGIFGGDGSDGPLEVDSGTTTINLGANAVVIKNYTKILILGTGKLAFTNPNGSGTIIILKSQGDVVLTSTANPNIDASGMGAAGGAPDAEGGTAYPLIDANTTRHGFPGTAGAGGSGGSQYGNVGLYTIDSPRFKSFGLTLACGSGGGGARNVGSPGTGGAGGAALVIECSGNLNVTGNISVAGAGGGTCAGGGSGGTCTVLYHRAISTSGTITDVGGSGGGQNNGNQCGGGGGGIGGTGGNGTGALGAGQGGGGGGAGGAGSGANGVAGGGGAGGSSSTSANHYIQI